MILVRNVFQLQFGRAKEARELLIEGVKFAERDAQGSARVLTDVTGPFYTLVLEITHRSLTDYEASMTKMAGNPEWSAWYRKFAGLVVSGSREIYSIVQ